MRIASRCSLVILILVALAGSSFAHGITNWPENKGGAVSITFDDGHPSQLSLAIPALDVRGIKGTFFLITDRVDTWAPWKNAALAGHEIGSHTKTHPYLTTLTTAQMHDEMGGSLPLIDAQVTSQKVFSMAYPYGDVNSSVSTVARAYYSAARGVDCQLNAPPYIFYDVKACSPDSLDDVYYQTDAAQQQGKWLVTFFHSLDGTGYGAWDIGELGSYLDYLKTKNLWVGPFDALVKYLREKADSSLSVTSSTADKIVLSLTDTLDDATYDQPLTLRSEVPSGWTSVKAVQGTGTSIVNSVVEGSTRVAYYNAVPDRGPITLTMSTASGNNPPEAVIDAPVQDTTINKGESVDFGGTGTDPDGNLPLSHRWRFGTGSGIPDSTERNPGTRRFDVPGVHTVTYTVMDSLGLPTPSPATRVITVLGPTPDVVIDNGGPGTSFTGAWDVSGASGSYGSNSVWSRDGSKYTWSFTPGASGNYDVSMWWTVWPSRSTSVPVDVKHSGGTARVTINQQGNGGRWNSLGTYSLLAGVSYTVTVTSQPGPSSTCADAVKFAYLGGGGVNQPPVAVNDSATTTKGTPVTINVIANDTDDAGINPASVAITTSPGNGTAVPDGSGSVTYTPAGTFTGTDTFQYTVADGQGAVSNTATVTVTVTPPAQNQPPVAVNDSATTTKGTPVTINVIANDTDDAGINPASVAITTSPGNGTAVPDGSGSVTYTPAGTFTGTDTFQYTVADGQGAVSNAATVTVTVNAVSVEVVIDNGGPGTSFTGGWDVSGASGSYGSSSVWSRDGSKYTWSFTPGASGNYDVSMWWTVWPSRSTSVPVDIKHSGGTARVTINQQGNGGRWNSLGTYSLLAGVSYTVTVTSQPGPSSTCADAVKFAYLGGGGVNQPPVAVNDSATTTKGTPVTINVIANDTDDAGINPASVAIVTSPGNGTAVPDGSGSVTYTPAGTFTGTDTFQYTVADGQGAVSNAATVTVTVNAVSVEVVIDNGGPGTSFTGAWDVSGASGSYGSSSVWSRDGSKYTWSFTPGASGNYDVSMWWTVWPSRSTSVPVDIKHSGGTARVTINQQGNGGRWNSLGTYSLLAGVSYTVTVTSQPGPSSTCADAVKFTLLANAEGYVAVGDSITFGSHDDIPADGTGFEPILANLLAASKGIPVTIANEGVSGATSADGAASISSTLSKYPSAKYCLIMYGSNDAYIPAVPSGMGLVPGDPGYSGSYKDNMQRIVSAVLAAGKTPYLAEVPYTSDTLRSNAMIYEYNAAVDELVLTNDILVAPPPFYAYFQTHQGELADGIHPNGTGYQSMATLWFNALTN